MEFFTSTIETLQTLVVALGSGLGVWRIINLLEGYGNDNPGAKSYVEHSNSVFLAVKHITLACIALAFLTALSCGSLDSKTFQQYDPGSKTLNEFKNGRNLRV